MKVYINSSLTYLNTKNINFKLNKYSYCKSGQCYVMLVIIDKMCFAKILMHDR